MISFSEVLKNNFVFDASGINNPHAYKWEKHGTIYFPSAKTPPIKVTLDTNKIPEIRALQASTTDRRLRRTMEYIIGGVNMIGEGEDIDDNTMLVTYPDGWVLPIRKDWLIKLD